MRREPCLVLALIFLLPLSTAASVGVSPGFIDVGAVERGESTEIEFYITASDIDEEFEVSPEYEPSLRNAQGSNAIIDMENVSEQDINPWIGFTQETYTIDPTTTEEYELPDGSVVNAAGVVTMQVDVPANPEPGYKLGEVHLNPDMGSGGSGTGARVLGQTVPSFAFRVPGPVERRIEVTDVRAVRTGENRVQIIQQIRNTGTVTTTLTGGTASVLDSNDQRVGAIDVHPATLTPGEYAEIDDTWSPSNLEGGQYRLDGSGDYRTGEMYVSGSFVVRDVIQDAVEIDEPSGGQTAEEESAPLVLIGIVSMLLASLLYIMEFSLYWNLVITGSVAALLFIALGSLPTYLALIPLAFMMIIWYI